MWGWATVLVARVRLWSSSPANTQLGTWVTFAPTSAFLLLHIALKWGQTGPRSLALWGLTCGLRSPIGPGALLSQRVSQEACLERQQQVRRRGEYPWRAWRRLAPDWNWIQRTDKGKHFFLCHTFPSQLPTLVYTCRPGLQRLNNETGMVKKQEFWGSPIFWTLTPHNTEYLNLQCS